MPRMLELDVAFDPIMVEDFAKLAKGAEVPMVIPDAEYVAKGKFLAEVFNPPVNGHGLKIMLMRLSEVDLSRLLRDKRYPRVYVGNRVWDNLDEETRNASRIRRIRFRITDESVKRIWGRIGLI
jgi:hypothetical protein